LVPVTEGVAAYAALKSAADKARAAGDERTRGQVMADQLVESVTGRSAGTTPIQVELVMTDDALLRGGDEPAVIPGYGPLPAGWARGLIADRCDRADPTVPDSPSDSSGAGSGDKAQQEVLVWLRLLYLDPAGRELAAM